MRIPAASPMWVGEVEIGGGGPPELDGPDGPPREDQTGARVLVRLQGRPLGFVTVPIPGAGELAEQVAAVAREEFEHEIRTHQGTVSATIDQRAVRDQPAISIVVCTRDRPDQLRRCLGRCKALNYPSFELVVVDNAPTGDETQRTFEETVGDDGRFRYVLERRPGLSNARNRGLDEARFHHVAFTDDDVLVDHDWLSGIAAGFASDETVACVTGLVAPAQLDTPAQHYMARQSAWPSATEPRLFDLGAHRDDAPCYPFCAGIFGAGANLAVDRQFVRAIGGFDPLLGSGTPTAGGEDLDLFVRVLYAGRSIAYEPSALVWHCHRPGERDLVRQLRGWGTGLGAFLAKQALSTTTRRDLFHRVPTVSRRVARAFMATGTRTGTTPGAPPFSGAEMRGVVIGSLTYLKLRLRGEEPGGRHD